MTTTQASLPEATPPALRRTIPGVGLHPAPLHGKPGKLMALDVGLARIGIAVCDPLQLAAHPHSILERRSRNEDFARLAGLVREQEIEAVICGLPLNMDGSEGEQAAATRKWALRLAQALRVLLGQPRPVIFWDERLSTFAAQEIRRREKRPPPEDAVAAAVILQSYLNALAAASPPEQLDAIVLPPAAPRSAD